MVILNALFGIILKLASVYSSILDLINFMNGLNSPEISLLALEQTLFNSFKLCSNDLFCALIERFGNLFYLISLSINLLFFYHFDKNIRTSFLSIFNREKKNTKNEEFNFQNEN